MSEKVKLTQEQDTRLKEMLGDVMYSKDSILTQHSKGWREKYKTCLNTLSLSQLARVLYEPNSYEVDLQFKVGDWVVSKGDRENRIKVVKTVHGEGISACTNSACVSTHYSNFRHATPEEIKAEKERQLWNSIGREIGEFKIGDTIELDRQLGFKIYLDRQIEVAKHSYQDRKVTGFYPSESFISFESEESK
jgi:hypothetical protein